MNVRADLGDAHVAAWNHLASPGSWWTGDQRLDLAATVVQALADADPLPPWVGPSTVDGRLAANLAAPAVAHDAAYRLARHAGTVTKDWYDDVSAAIGELAYVELVSIVSTVAAVAHFSRNVGVDVPDLPSPRPGPPTGLVPDEIVQPELNWVPVAAPADQAAAVVQAYTGVPAEFENLWRLSDAQYMPAGEMGDPNWTRREGGLSRPQIELVASRVSQLRECFY